MKLIKKCKPTARLDLRKNQTCFLNIEDEEEYYSKPSEEKTILDIAKECTETIQNHLIGNDCEDFVEIRINRHIATVEFFNNNELHFKAFGFEWSVMKRGRINED